MRDSKLTPVPATSRPGAIQAGEEAAQELAEALKLIGIKFPSLRGGFPVLGRPTVELGGCSPEVAKALAAWIRERA